MANRAQREMLFVEDNMADVAVALGATERLWAHLRSMCRRQPSLEQIGAMGEELRLIESGLAAARRGLVEQRAEIGEEGGR